MHALLLVLVEPLAVVAANALGDQDLRSLDRSPLAGLLTQLAGLALGPPLDLEDGEVRDDSQRGADALDVLVCLWRFLFQLFDRVKKDRSR